MARDEPLPVEPERDDLARARLAPDDDARLRERRAVAGEPARDRHAVDGLGEPAREVAAVDAQPLREHEHVPEPRPRELDAEGAARLEAGVRRGQRAGRAAHRRVLEGDRRGDHGVVEHTIIEHTVVGGLLARWATREGAAIHDLTRGARADHGDAGPRGAQVGERGRLVQGLPRTEDQHERRRVTPERCAPTRPGLVDPLSDAHGVS